MGVLNRLIYALLWLASLFIVLIFLVYENREKVGRWAALILMAAFFGLYSAEMWVMMPDWVDELMTISPLNINGRF